MGLTSIDRVEGWERARDLLRPAIVALALAALLLARFALPLVAERVLPWPSGSPDEPRAEAAR